MVIAKDKIIGAIENESDANKAERITAQEEQIGHTDHVSYDVSKFKKARTLKTATLISIYYFMAIIFMLLLWKNQRCLLINIEEPIPFQYAFYFLVLLLIPIAYLVYLHGEKDHIDYKHEALNRPYSGSDDEIADHEVGDSQDNIDLQTSLRDRINERIRERLDRQ